MALCQITLMGNLGRDPELRYTPGGGAVCQFSVAVNQGRKDKTTGAWTDDTDWFRVSVFGERGERAAEQLRKGSRVLVAGRFKSREWTDKEGVKHTTLEVTASELVGLDRTDKASVAPGGSTTGVGGSEDLSELPF